MPEAARYSAIEVLRDGSRVEIRALRPEDRAAVLAAVDHTSARSLYRRFFAARRSFTEREIAFSVNVDFTNHVALIAMVKHDDGGEEIVGGERYVMLQPGRAEAAFTVVEQKDRSHTSFLHAHGISPTAVTPARWRALLGMRPQRIFHRRVNPTSMRAACDNFEPLTVRSKEELLYLFGFQATTARMGHRRPWPSEDEPGRQGRNG